MFNSVLNSQACVTLKRLLPFLFAIYLLNLVIAQDEVIIEDDPVTHTAQTDHYVGFGASFLLYFPILHAHIGFDDLIDEQVDLRLSLELFPYVYNLSTDAIFQSPSNDATFSSYTGAGVRLIYFNDVYSREFLPGVGVLVGLRYDLDSVSLFSEFEFDVVLAPSDLRDYIGLPVVPLPLLRFGVEYPF